MSLISQSSGVAYFWCVMSVGAAHVFSRLPGPAGKHRLSEALRERRLSDEARQPRRSPHQLPRPCSRHQVNGDDHHLVFRGTTVLRGTISCFRLCRHCATVHSKWTMPVLRGHCRATRDGILRHTMQTLHHCTRQMVTVSSQLSLRDGLIIWKLPECLMSPNPCVCSKRISALEDYS